MQFWSQREERVRVAMYAAAATLLFVIERLIPNPLPWVRLGLANLVTVIVLYEHGFMAAGWVVALRLVLGSFFAGTLLGPQFVLAVAGSLGSLVIMSTAKRLGGRIWSPLGISVLGSLAHAAAQLAVVAVVFAAGAGVLTLVPVFLLLSTLTGVVTGVLAEVLVRRLQWVTHSTAPQS